MRFLADGTVRHGAGLEAPDDLIDRLDLVDGNRLARRRESHQATQGTEILRLVVDERRELLVHVVALGTNRVLQLRDGFRAEQVVFAIVAEAVLAAGIKARTTNGSARVAFTVTAA